MAVIDHDTVTRILDAADIVDVIQDFVTLKKRGANYIGLCPFHHEKTPSFNVSPSKGIYKCFGCGKGGSVVNFLMEHEHFSYPEALKYLARKYSIEVTEKELTDEEKRQQSERESLLVLTSWAQKYFTRMLNQHPEGREVGMSYFRERGFREETLKEYQLGYCPEERGILSKSALQAGYKKEFLLKSGLSVERGSELADRFSGRVIFPIHSISGQVIGFGGRVLKSGEKTAKYLNSPESEIYHKSRIVYGIFQAKREIISREKCYLVEGYTDVLSLYQAGIKNVVASSGTALTPEQIRLIRRFTGNVTVIYDGDEAGIKASLRGIDLLLEEGLDVRVVAMPPGEDPDSFARKVSQTELEEYIRIHEQDFISFKTSLLLEEASSDPVKRAQMITEVVRSIALISDRIKRAVYIRECASLLDIDEKILYTEVYQRRRKKAEETFRKFSLDQEVRLRSTPVPSFVKEVYSEPQEKEIIRLLLHYGDRELFPLDELAPESEYISVAEYIIQEIKNDELEFKNLVYRKIFEDYQRLLSRGEEPDHRYFINHEDPDVRELVADLLSNPYVLSKVHSRKGVHVKTEDLILKKSVPETLIAYKTKILKMAAQEKLSEIGKAQEKKLPPEEITRIQQEYRIIKEVITTIAHDRKMVIIT
ncbi:MAG: DNA primase [Bacteroidales bacterium]